MSDNKINELQALARAAYNRRQNARTFLVGALAEVPSDVVIQLCEQMAQAERAYLDARAALVAVGAVAE